MEKKRKAFNSKTLQGYIIDEDESKVSKAKIEFFDQTGRIAFKEVTPELLKGIHSFNIPFSKFEKGIYTVRISDGESNLINKMIRH